MRTLRLVAVLAAVLAPTGSEAGTTGYYRQPSIAHGSIVFIAEGDLWKVPLAGGVARRLTTHPGLESLPSVSPDGKSIAFVGRYEGPAEVYTIPFDGGLPRRRTFDSANPLSIGWTPDGKILVGTRSRSGLPSVQLLTIDPGDDRPTLVPLAEAAEGAYSPEDKTLIFTRLPFQGSHTRQYRGGTAGPLALCPRRRRGGAVDRQISRHEQVADVARRAGLLRQRPERDHEPLVDETRRIGPQFPHES